MSVSEKMTTLADEVRELSGTSKPLGLDAMISHINDANDEVDVQSNLIDQLSEILDNKTAGGGKIETCTVSFPESISYNSNIYYLDSDLTTKKFTLGQAGTISVVKNSIISIDRNTMGEAYFYSGLRSDSGVLYISKMPTANSDNYLSCIITDNAIFYFYENFEVT